MRVAVFISGRGSNLQSLIDACAEPGFPAEIVRVVSNIPQVFGLERAEKAGIPTAVVDHRQFASREDFEAALEAALAADKVELICLAGFMRLLTDAFTGRWRDKLINIHPSLLPAFKGLHTHERALEAGVKLAGCTVHFVRPAMDEGPIIAQAAVPVLDKDTAETLAARVLEQEHTIYPLALKLIAQRRTRVRGGHVLIDAAKPDETARLVNPPR